MRIDLSTPQNVSAASSPTFVTMKLTHSGSFTLSSGVATIVDATFTAKSVVIPTLKTASGTRAGSPDIVVTATTGFVATAVNTDNSTYNYIVVEVFP